MTELKFSETFTRGLIFICQLIMYLQGSVIAQNTIPYPAELIFTNEFVPGAKYDATIPAPEKLLGFQIGQKATTPEQIWLCLNEWSKAAPEKSILVEYARSYENRPLYYLIISSKENISKLDQIRTNIARLADPRQITEDHARKIIQGLPAIAWLGYTIHGTETEGSDAALAMIYHLLASRDLSTEKILKDVVVIIDPLMNPDGRNRFLKMIIENRGFTPNIDSQDLMHSGYWPQGRGNHYLMDMNRDWIYGVHPETRGRIRHINKWNPQFMMDAHGMGALDTHLFSPPREPINPYIPQSRFKWCSVFEQNLASAFDRYRLLYYTGEWHEEWFPGYSDAFCSLRGAIGILHEQASIAGDGVKRPENRILTYRESVFHHFIASIANLQTVQENAKELLQNFYNIRKEAIDPKGRFAHKTYVILPTENRSRLYDLLKLLDLQGIEFYSATEDISVPLAIDQLSREHKNYIIQKDSILVPNRQPLAHLVSAMFEFDPKMSTNAIAEERKEILEKGRTRIYDTTAWNLTMMYAFNAVTLPSDLPTNSVKITSEEYARGTGILPQEQELDPAAVAYIVDGKDDLSTAFAAKALEEGIQVRMAEKEFMLEDKRFSRGSIVITALDNRNFKQKLIDKLKETGKALRIKISAVTTGLSPGNLPDLGGRHFKRLEYPRIAIMGREGFSASDYGSIWFTIDNYLGIRHSKVDETEVGDFYRYNVIIYPDGSPDWTSNRISALKDWVKAGGTLILVGNSANGVIAERSDFSKVRSLPEALSRLTEYESVIYREWLAASGKLPDLERLWSNKLTPGLEYPWQISEGGFVDEKELRRRDSWQALFMPQGAFLAARVNTNHWLTAGCGDILPVLAGRYPVLMAGEGVEAPIRYGVFVNTSNHAEKNAGLTDKKDSQLKDKKEVPRIGFCAPIPGTEFYLRMSGLLWQEAAHRIANTAWLTREQYGRGQIIIFATPPTFRAAARGTTRVFLNAIVFGPGCGTTQSVKP